LWVAILMAVMFAVAALVVDGSIRIDAYLKADSITREAARAACQEIDPDNPGQVDYGPARATGIAYMTAAGCEDGTITVGGDKVTASCNYRYETVFWPGSHLAAGVGSATPMWVP
jgi:Flp pilus assembly protein TadG